MMLLSSEWLKTKRTAIRWLLFCMPVVYALAIVSYFYLREMEKGETMFIFQTFFEAWTVFVIPLSVGILSGYMIYQEELAGGFNGLLSNKTPRYKLYIGKLTLLTLITVVSTFIALVVLGIGLSVTLGITIEPFIFTAAAILAIVGTLPLLTIHLWASFAWGVGASIGISIGGLLMAALFGATNLGDKIWPFIPWAWPARLAKLPGIYLMYTADMDHPPEAISSGFVLNQLGIGLIAVIICVLVTLIIGILWFNKWEGRKSNE